MEVKNVILDKKCHLEKNQFESYDFFYVPGDKKKIKKYYFDDQTKVQNDSTSTSRSTIILRINRTMLNSLVIITQDYIPSVGNRSVSKQQKFF